MARSIGSYRTEVAVLTRDLSWWVCSLLEPQWLTSWGELGGAADPSLPAEGGNRVQPPKKLKCAFPRTPGDSVGQRQKVFFLKHCTWGAWGGAVLLRT